MVYKGGMEKLNTMRVRIELAKLDKNWAWLGRQIGYTRQYMHHIKTTGKLTIVDKMAKALNVDTKDLIQSQ